MVWLRPYTNEIKWQGNEYKKIANFHHHLGNIYSLYHASLLDGNRSILLLEKNFDAAAHSKHWAPTAISAHSRLESPKNTAADEIWTFRSAISTSWPPSTRPHRSTWWQYIENSMEIGGRQNTCTRIRADQPANLPLA